MIEIEILKEGRLIRNEQNMILNAESSVTLIKSPNLNIIVDTSIKSARSEIISKLNDLNLTPNEIDIVFSTHNHHDHVSNNEIFENSKKYVNKLELKKRKRNDFIPLIIDPKKPYQLDENIELIATPGHTIGSTSVIIKINEKNYVITGDAIPIKENYINWVPPIINVNYQSCLDSMERIKKIADFIIPGHGKIFKVNK
ncbi:MAG: MBL fold metallo-hydrolase [Candidatus Helarchaeota archaeon]